jgi:hypothetical protein
LGLCLHLSIDGIDEAGGPEAIPFWSSLQSADVNVCAEALVVEKSSSPWSLKLEMPPAQAGIAESGGGLAGGMKGFAFGALVHD